MTGRPLGLVPIVVSMARPMSALAAMAMGRSGSSQGQEEKILDLGCTDD